MATSVRARVSLALIAALAVTTFTAVGAAATDAEPRPPVIANTAPLTAAEAEQADESETARVAYDAAPQFSPATTASVTGTLKVYDLDGTGPFAAPSESSWVRFWRLNPDDDLWYWQVDVDTFGVNGEFEVSGLEPGQYRVEFVSYGFTIPVREYWADKSYWFAADELPLNANTSTGLGTITLEPAEPDFYRISGADRFETSVAISQSIVPPGGTAPVVYVVTGMDYADALSAGPAAARGGGVMLLTLQSRLPDVVKSELDRINPERIVVVGGPSVVSTAVETALQAYVNAPGDVIRIHGADRYATSRLIVADAFAEGIPNLFIATGRNFPDALAAGPAASRLGGAVLLVNGNASTADLATRTLITELGMPDLHLAGGPSVVSTGVQNSLTAHVGASATVTRYAGANRYDTALVMNWEVFGAQGTDFAFLATGAGFADALAGGPLAAAYDAPLYLSTQRCLRADEYFDMIWLLSTEIYGLGGPSVLSDRVLGGALC